MMTELKKQRVVIAGGGTAGWMTAAALSKLLGKNLDITLVESDEIGTVGVGEATIPTLHIFHQLLGLKESEVMAATNATFKLGISFENWRDKNQDYLHSFGFLGKDCWAAKFHHFWLKGSRMGIVQQIGDYCAEHLAAREHRFATHPNQDRNHAYHMDATLYAKYLRVFAEKFGVMRIEGKISDVRLREDNGCIDSLQLQSGAVLTGDLFIDCTGFSGLLIEKALHTGYEDWSHWLPCDRAIAVQTESTGEFLPYTRSIAHESGWQWRIPLQTRTGNGMVFCSRYWSDEEAIAKLTANIEGEMLTKPRVIAFRTGSRRKHWNKNCVAIGLSAGFIEPLESTSIHLIQRSIIRLMQLFPAGAICQSDSDEFNEQTRQEMENIRDFIILHYHVTERADTKFWRYCRSMSVPDSLAHRLQHFRETGRIYKYGADLFSESSWVQVMLGQGLMPQSYHPIVDLMTDTELNSFLERIRLQVRQSVDELPAHIDFVKTYCPSSVSLNVTETAPSMPDFSVSALATPVHCQIGNAKTPIVVIDNFAQDEAKSVRAFAANARFTHDDVNLYPGIRAPLPADYVSSVVAFIGKKIQEVYGIPTGMKLKVTQACYSLVTQPASTLGLLQRIPHFDTPSPFSFAVLHYLAEGQHGGTGFFRHIPSQLERVGEADKDNYFSIANDFIRRIGEPEKSYISRDNGHYDLYHQIDYLPNRLAIYPGNLLHSGLILPKQDISSDLIAGRLTANIFIHFE